MKSGLVVVCCVVLLGSLTVGQSLGEGKNVVGLNTKDARNQIRVWAWDTVVGTGDSGSRLLADSEALAWLEISAFVVDLSADRLYFSVSDLGTDYEGAIYSANLDGTDAQVLVDNSSPGAWYLSLALDDEGRTLYYTSEPGTGATKIMSLDLSQDAAPVEWGAGVVSTIGTKGLSLVIHNGFMYWSENDSGLVAVVRRAPLDDPGAVLTLMTHIGASGAYVSDMSIDANDNLYYWSDSVLYGGSATVPGTPNALWTPEGINLKVSPVVVEDETMIMTISNAASASVTWLADAPNAANNRTVGDGALNWDGIEMFVIVDENVISANEPFNWVLWGSVAGVALLVLLLIVFAVGRHSGREAAMDDLSNTLGLSMTGGGNSASSDSSGKKSNRPGTLTPQVRPTVDPKYESRGTQEKRLRTLTEAGY